MMQMLKLKLLIVKEIMELHLKLESSSIKLTPGSGANADKLTMNFEWGSF